MPYTPLYAQNFTSSGGGDLSNLNVSGNTFMFGTLNCISNSFFMNTLKVTSNLIVTTNAYVGTTLNVVNYINTAYLNTAGLTTTGNIANTAGNVALTGNLITTNVFCTNVITQSNISNTFGNVAITGNLVTSQNIYCTNLFLQSNIANVYGNVALTGNLITTNVYCTNVITQSNVSNTFGNVAITGNLVTSQNIYCMNLFLQSNIANVYGNVALTGNLITTNIFCTNVITQSNVSNTFGNVAITGNLLASQNVFAQNMILTTNIVQTAGTVNMSGNAIVQSNLQANNLTVNYFINGLFALIGSSYFYLNNSLTLPALLSKSSGVVFYGISLSNFQGGQSSKYLTITPNGNFQFNTTGLYKLTAVFASDAAFGRAAVGASTNDYTTGNRPANMNDYVYVYQYDVTQVPTVPVTIPILVTNTSLIYYIDIFAYRTLPTVLYPTNKANLGDYTDYVGGTYLAIAPF
jgi:hypothetical protein